MSSPSPSAAQPQVSDFDFQSPYFEQVISTIVHAQNIQECLQDIQEAEDEMRETEDTMNEVKDLLREGQAKRRATLEEKRRATLEDLAKARHEESLYYSEYREAVNNLSETEAVIKSLKMFASSSGIDIEKAVVNVPEERIAGASDRRYNSKRKRTIGLGVLTLWFWLDRDSLKASVLSSQEAADNCKRMETVLQSMLTWSDQTETGQLNLLDKCHGLIARTRELGRKTLSLLILEQERLSRSVVDLVLEWKRNNLEED
ncbi:hypothetical protein JCM5353_007580 [Sporobolomyces roseus]